MNRKSINLCDLANGASLFACAAAVLAAGPAWAQADQDQRASRYGLEDIIVTAQKRSSDVQKTPVAVTAYTSEAIDRAQIKGIKELQYTTPGLVFGQTSNISQVTLRGVGINFTSVGAEAGVASYIDEVYQGRTFLQSQDNPSIGRIEVLRGPQGTLYGRNTTGGVVNYYTKTASYTPDIGAEIIAGNYDRLQAELWASGPIVPDKVAVRVDLSRNTRDGYVDNLLTGKPYSNLKQNSVRGNVLIEPTESLQVIVRGHWSKLDGGSPANVLRVTNPAIAGPLNPNPLADLFPPIDTNTGQPVPVPAPGLVGPTPWRQYYNTDPVNKVFNIGWNAAIRLEMGDVTLKSLSAYERYRQHILYDIDGTSADWFAQNSIEKSRQFTQEFTLLGTSLGGRLDWVVGAFYLDDDAHGEYAPTLSGQKSYFTSLFTLLGGAPDWTSVAPLFGPVRNEPILDFDFRQKLKSYAAYAQATFSVTDTLRLTAGIRYSRDKKKVDYAQASQIAGSCQTDPDRPWRNDGSAVTPKAGIEFDVAPQQMLYASVTKGYKGGGINAFSCGMPDPDNPGMFLGNSYDSEKVLAYEGGYKARVLDNRLAINLAGFYYDYKNVQIQNYVGSAILITNAGAATIYGAELELTGRPIPNLEISGSVGYLHARYDSGPAVDPFTNASLPNGLAGKAIPLSPDWKASAAIGYDFDLGGGAMLTPRVDVAYSSQYYFDALNTPGNDQPAYTIVNAHVTFKANDKLELDAFMMNIGNKVHWETSAPSGTSAGGIVGTIAAPRTFGVRARLRM